MMNRLVVISILFFLISCSDKNEKPTFSSWYKANISAKSGEFDSTKIHTKTISSELFKIDTIYRSMVGPTSDQIFKLADSGDLVWLVSYEVKVFDSTKTAQLSQEFMCHNNLNLTKERQFPWLSDVFGYTNRIFTLTQGFTKLNLPEGFGIPFPSNQNFKTIFQALNHNKREIETSLKHEVILKYFLDSEIDFEMKALSQNTIWLVKQYSGPKGVYGEKPIVHETTSSNFVYHPSQQPVCGVDMLANNPISSQDLYYDSYGRKFTGHWKVSPGKEFLRFKATKMLNLKEDKMLYFATAHVHPYCEFLELRDLTADKSIFKSKMINFSSEIGLKKISTFTSSKGVELFKSHDYELISSYNNIGKDTLSAMSVLYLYWEY